MRFTIIGLGMLLALNGCWHSDSWKIKSALSKYKAVQSQIEIGDSKDKVLGIILPAQEGLTIELSKSPEKYVRDGVRTEIYYMRSGWVSDGRTTDDEFTPYVFENGKLTAIGWQTLGGPKVISQTSPSSSTTVIKSSPTRTHCMGNGMGGMQCQSY